VHADLHLEVDDAPEAALVYGSVVGERSRENGKHALKMHGVGSGRGEP
jgi:hypothetical protein